jgi:dienelactone hydrolase
MELGRRALAGAAVAVLLAAASARADAPLPPIVGAELPRGTVDVTPVADDPAAAQRPRRADGRISDWLGRLTGFAGEAHYSRGEYIYEDHLWDAYGAADALGSARATLLDSLAQADGDLFRVEAVALYAPTGTAYGAGPLDVAADLTEVRVACSGSTISLLARTTVMTADQQPAILVLADTRPGSTSHAIPFGSGLTTTRADVAMLLAADRGVAVDLATGERRSFPVKIDPDGYDNAVEADIPRELVVGPSDPGSLRLAVAAGRLDPATGEMLPRNTGPAIANVAFRHEPARPTFEKLQALALHGGDIDPFFADISLASLRSGRTESVVPRPGYHDRVMTTDPAISREEGTQGVLQHYGVYVPPGYVADGPSATTIFLHGSGNDAHDLPIVIPGLMRALGDERDSIVIAPKGRSALSLWEGAGLVDLLAAWRDAGRAFALDARRTTIAGYSMGGLGAYLVASLLPDRFAASFAIAGPVGGDVASPGVGLRQLPDVRRAFANLRWVPTAIYSGGIDNNVPPTNGIAAADTLAALGYRYRLHLFPADNHFSPGLVDRWDPAVDYLAGSPRLDPDPPRVTFVRDMAFEHDVDEARYSDEADVPAGGHGLRFDRAYWMCGLTATDTEHGVAGVDVRSLAIPAREVTAFPERGVGASPDPFAWEGRRWEAGRRRRLANRIDLTAHGTAALCLDTTRMRLDAHRRISIATVSDSPFDLRLRSASAGTRTIRIPRGRSTIVVPPSDPAGSAAASGVRAHLGGGRGRRVGPARPWMTGVIRSRSQCRWPSQAAGWRLSSVERCSPAATYRDGLSERLDLEQARRPRVPARQPGGDAHALPALAPAQLDHALAGVGDQRLGDLVAAHRRRGHAPHEAAAAHGLAAG